MSLSQIRFDARNCALFLQSMRGPVMNKNLFSRQSYYKNDALFYVGVLLSSSENSVQVEEYR